MLRGDDRPRGAGRQTRRLVGRDPRSDARLVGRASELQAIVSSRVHELVEGGLIKVDSFGGVVWLDAAERIVNQWFEGVGLSRGWSNTKSSAVTHGSSCKGRRGWVKCRLDLRLVFISSLPGGDRLGLSGLVYELKQACTRETLTCRPSNLTSAVLIVLYRCNGSLMIMLDKCPCSESLECLYLLPRSKTLELEDD